MTTTIDLTMPIYEGMPGHPFHGRTPIFLSGTLNHRMYEFMERRNPYSNEKISFANEQTPRAASSSRGARKRSRCTCDRQIDEQMSNCRLVRGDRGAAA